MNASTRSSETPETVPSAAVQLGYAGLMPFLAGALLTFPIAGDMRPWGTTLLLGYGAIILSFMGGVHWGAAMIRDDVTTPALGKSVAPSLVALPAILIGGLPGSSSSCWGSPVCWRGMKQKQKTDVFPAGIRI